MVLIMSNATNQGADLLRAAFQSATPFQGNTHTRVNKIHGVQAGSSAGMLGNMYWINAKVQSPNAKWMSKPKCQNYRRII